MVAHSKAQQSKHSERSESQASEQRQCFLELLARVASGRPLVGPSGERWEAGRMLLCPSCFRMRSDVLAVVKVGRIQAIVMPLTPLLHCLPGSLFLL